MKVKLASVTLGTPVVRLDTAATWVDEDHRVVADIGVPVQPVVHDVDLGELAEDGVIVSGTVVHESGADVVSLPREGQI